MILKPAPQIPCNIKVFGVVLDEVETVLSFELRRTRGDESANDFLTNPGRLVRLGSGQ